MNNRICTSEIADDILQRIPVFGTVSGRTLVVVSVAALGFKNGATRREIYERAIELGLLPVPAEVAPQLRLQYADQPRGESLLVAMEPIADSYFGDQFILYVAHLEYDLWIGAEFGAADYFWGSDYRWVFMRRN